MVQGASHAKAKAKEIFALMTELQHLPASKLRHWSVISLPTILDWNSETDEAVDCYSSPLWIFCCVSEPWPLNLDRIQNRSCRVQCGSDSGVKCSTPPIHESNALAMRIPFAFGSYQLASRRLKVTNRAILLCTLFHLLFTCRSAELSLPHPNGTKNFMNFF